MPDIVKRLEQEGITASQNEPMAKHTSFRTGGPCDYFAPISTIRQLKACIALCTEEKIPYYVMGNGTNLLVRDKGFRGMMIQLFDQFQKIVVKGTTIQAQAGALLSSVAKEAQYHTLSDFAFASGIPGTIGGAVTMNAGAYDGELKDVLCSATVLTKQGECKEYTVEELNLSYRKSRVAEEGMIVLDATFAFHPGDPDEIARKMADFACRRREKQPLQYPSAGSTFKRPPGYFAGKLIEDSGLKGKKIGGAMVSEKHAGFLINFDHASSADILELIAFCRETVQKKCGVWLEPEVKIIGEE